jgi:hypothetical protein
MRQKTFESLQLHPYTKLDSVHQGFNTGFDDSFLYLTNDVFHLYWLHSNKWEAG